jgi:hypothetical protein
VDTAVKATLEADTTLLALMPDGVWMDVAPPNAKRFVLVKRIEHADTDGLGATLYERLVYQVDARARDTEGTDVRSAADRIHALLQRQPLTIAGYAWMQTLRTQPLRVPPDLDPLETDSRWQYRGAFYEVHVSPES